MRLISGDKVECIKSGLMVKLGSTGVVAYVQEWGDCMRAMVEWDNVDCFTSKREGSDRICSMDVDNLKICNKATRNKK